MAWTRYIDLGMSDDEMLDTVMPIPSKAPNYPAGCRICLCGPELDKLGIDEMPKIGDYIDIRAFATVTSVSDSQGGGRRLELQIEKLAFEDEDTEEGPDDD